MVRIYFVYIEYLPLCNVPLYLDALNLLVRSEVQIRLNTFIKFIMITGYLQTIDQSLGPHMGYKLFRLTPDMTKHGLSA